MLETKANLCHEEVPLRVNLWAKKVMEIFIQSVTLKVTSTAPICNSSDTVIVILP